MLLLYLFLLLLPHTAFSSHCTTQTNTKTFQKCMNLPTQQASIAWTFHPYNSTLELAFFGTFISPSGWVGCGINPTSPEMTGTRALIAFPDPNSGQIVLLPYILDPTVKLQKSPLLSRPLDIHLLSSTATMYGGKLATVHNGAAIQIYASIKLKPNKTKIHLVWNRGLYVQGYSPTIHPTTSSDLSSITTFDVLSGSSASQHHDLTGLRVIHGTLNAISWGLLLPMGAISARYLRHIQALGTTWFYAHAGIQLFAFTLGTAGFALGIRLGQLSPGVEYGLHRKLGIAVFCLGALQTLALFFRPNARNKFRKYWKSYHHFVGYSCVVLGFVNVFQGFQVMGASRSYAKLCYCLGLSTLIGICIALEVNSWVVFCRKSKEEKLRREGLIGVSDKGSSAIHH
ncbi:cytochrome b561 and DOMON domain-containing protein At2g04850 [Arachis stenosperma]|uniref:cytochrome b561 and DOMON domain-containing protein At2g04850 n=1 Tax=Arachis stenosperma TaxID=217475 RepID=UPI0025AD1960|nr:cytochrome b561 and DOMON domain-containing protein At2g04850 [Arachis stenosperma]